MRLGVMLGGKAWATLAEEVRQAEKRGVLRVGIDMAKGRERTVRSGKIKGAR